MSDNTRTSPGSTVIGSTDGSSCAADDGLNAAIDRLLGSLPPVKAGEDQLRERSRILALAIGAAIQAKDFAAREVFLDALCALGDAGAGVILAVEHLTAIRLDGLPEGGLKPDAAITPDFKYAPLDGTDDEQKRYVARLEIITHIWTGKAAGLPTRYTHGMSQFARSSVADIRAMIIIMAQDVADRIERFVAWNGDGWGHLEDYRHANPMPGNPLQP